jgi:predicted small lipoprotein YifL
MVRNRRLLLVALALLPLTACGKKGEPERPSGSKSPEHTYPKPDPVPWQAQPQQKTK